MQCIRDRSGGLFVAAMVLGVDKPSLSVRDQSARLRQRGLDDDGTLTRALMTHGYFRLSGYWRYFRVDPSSPNNAFVHGSRFSEVFSVYQRDADLRNLLLEGLAEVEVALRTSLAANLCAPGADGTEYQQESTYLDRRDAHGNRLRDRLLHDVRDDITRSKERHVRHHRARGGAGSVPLWVATEAMSFGTLSRMYGLLADESTQRAVAKRFGYDGGLFSAFGTNLRAVAVFRNVCAHHGRLWNRTIHQDQPRLFSGAFGRGDHPARYHNSAWGIIAVLGHLVSNIRRDDSFADAVRALADDGGPYWEGLSAPDPR